VTSVDTVAALLELVEHSSKNEPIDAPVDVWLRAVRDVPEAAFMLAGRPEAPDVVNVAICLVGDRRCRSRVAMKHAASPQVLGLLASDDEEGVVGHVVHHPKTPRWALEALLGHPWDKVRSEAERRVQLLDLSGDG